VGRLSGRSSVPLGWNVAPGSRASRGRVESSSRFAQQGIAGLFPYSSPRPQSGCGPDLDSTLCVSRCPLASLGSFNNRFCVSVSIVIVDLCCVDLCCVDLCCQFRSTCFDRRVGGSATVYCACVCSDRSRFPLFPSFGLVRMGFRLTL
jgi:hypothetical protein